MPDKSAPPIEDAETRKSSSEGSPSIFSNSSSIFRAQPSDDDDAPPPHATEKHDAESLPLTSLDVRIQDAPRARGGFAGVRSLFNFPEHTGELRSTAWLDGLRGLAAFEVFLFHYCDGWFDHSRGYGELGEQDRVWWRLPFVRSLYASGDTAVCVFFAISGYVLTYRMLHLLRQQRKEELYSSLTSAIFRRGIRLYLPVIIESFILMLMARIGLPKAAVYNLQSSLLLEINQWIWNIIHLLMPLRYPDRWDEIMNFYDGTISWTIPLEYYGSVIVYTTLLFLSKTRNLRTRQCLMALFAFTSFLKDDWIGAQFLMGMAFADYQLEREEKAHRADTTRGERRRALVCIGIFAFGLYLSGIPGSHPVNDYSLHYRPFYHWISQPLAWLGAYHNRNGDRYLDCVAGVCLLIGIGETPRLKKVMETRIVQYLGKISFGLYLCHIFLHAWLKKLDPLYFGLVGLDPSTARETGGVRYFVAYVLMLVPSILVNFMVGSLFERYLDRPSVRAAKFFEQWCLSKD